MSACPVLYPENPPLDCIRELVRILRAGSIYQERANFAAHAWNVQGYLQRMLVGNPRPLIAEVSLSTDDAIRALEKIALIGSQATQGWPVSLTALLRYLVSRLIDALLEEGR